MVKVILTSPTSSQIFLFVMYSMYSTGLSFPYPSFVTYNFSVLSLYQNQIPVHLHLIYIYRTVIYNLFGDSLSTYFPQYLEDFGKIPWLMFDFLDQPFWYFFLQEEERETFSSFKKLPSQLIWSWKHTWTYTVSQNSSQILAKFFSHHTLSWWFQKGFKFTTVPNWCQKVKKSWKSWRTFGIYPAPELGRIACTVIYSTPISYCDETSLSLMLAYSLGEDFIMLFTFPRRSNGTVCFDHAVCC